MSSTPLGENRGDQKSARVCVRNADDAFAARAGEPRLDDAFVAHVRGLDPLGADAILARVPSRNAAGDVHALCDDLRRIAPSEARVAASSVAECVAAMRDIGVILGSIKRHGVEPAERVPSLAPALFALGSRTGMVPRDTVYHYGPWNPEGPRQRMYTGDPAETVLIHSVRTTAPAIENALERLARAIDAVPASADFAEHGDAACADLAALVESMGIVRRTLPPLFFARSLRPYFEPVVLRGETYLGPAAAHLPLYLIDQIVWASDRGEPAYREFQVETARHGLPRHRALFDSRTGRASLVTRVVEALREDPAAAPGSPLFESAAAVRRLLDSLIAFRGRHIVLARREYGPHVRLYPVGSGGATVFLLEDILSWTRACAAAATLAARAT